MTVAMAIDRTVAKGREYPPGATVTIRVRYFAVLREERGMEEELISTGVATAAELYDELRCRFSFSLSTERLRVACNGDFVPWSQPIAEGDLVVFIPPVAGG